MATSGRGRRSAGNKGQQCYPGNPLGMRGWAAGTGHLRPTHTGRELHSPCPNVFPLTVACKVSGAVPQLPDPYFFLEFPLTTGSGPIFPSPWVLGPFFPSSWVLGPLFPSLWVLGLFFPSAQGGHFELRAFPDSCFPQDFSPHHGLQDLGRIPRTWELDPQTPRDPDPQTARDQGRAGRETQIHKQEAEHRAELPLWRPGLHREAPQFGFSQQDTRCHTRIVIPEV